MRCSVRTASSHSGHFAWVRLGFVARILVVDDDKQTSDGLARSLRSDGHEVDAVATGTAALSAASDHPPDLIMLELALTDMPGTEVCKQLRAGRATGSIPIVAVTELSDEIDRVVAFELGVDDYVTKPFSVRELTLRVRAVLRRQTSPRQSARMVEFGALRCDREAHKVWIDGAPVNLTPRELRLLLAIYDEQGRVLTRDALLTKVWGEEADISTRTVDAHVKRLREKLGIARDYVRTVRGVGYRFATLLDRPPLQRQEA